MRIDLVLQGLHAGVQQQTFLLFEFDLNSDAIPNLKLGADDHNGSSIDERLHPRFRAFQAESGMGKKARHFRLEQSQHHNGDEEHDLPVEQARPGQIASDPTINA